ncbi:MAG: oligoendopeptidase F [Candidatus Zixiibacteriota bacterium]|nr:MAG: oligoendopeptidase F [candidate division Zixibacteria bacterium]
MLLSGHIAAQTSQSRDEIDDKYKWDLSDIYADWDAWEQGMADFERLMGEFAAFKGTLAQGPDQLLKVQLASDQLGMLLYKVYQFPSLSSATDTRDNEIAARLQRIQILYARFQTETAWFSPELLAIDWSTMEKWLNETEGLAPYRYQIENLYRQQAHVLDEDKEKLLAYFNRFESTPAATYRELATSDINFPDITLSSGDTVTVTPGMYYNILGTNRNQEDRAKAFEAHYSTYHANVNTYAAIYNSVLQSDWAETQARNYETSLEAALDGDNVPVSVYETLVNTVKAGTEPLRRFYRLRKEKLGLETYHLYDGSIPLVEFDKEYEYDDIIDWIVECASPLGRDYQDDVRRAFDSRWIDVYESEGKRSGAFQASVYGVHPYLLLNYNKTMDNVLAVVHEMGHCMHTIMSDANQPFATADATIFVAEVPSTMYENFLVDYLLERSDDPLERLVLLQRSIENILGTFYTQVMFADFEWQAHQMVEAGQPITAEILRNLYKKLLTDYYGDAADLDDLYGSTWTRIAHFYRTPFYVYKYATSFAASAKLYKELASEDRSVREDALDRYTTLLKSGGNDYPMEQLKKAGVDLSDPATIQAVVDQLDDLVTRFEAELAKL